MTDFLRLIDVNAGGFRLKKGQGIRHPNFWILGALRKGCSREGRVVQIFHLVVLVGFPQNTLEAFLVIVLAFLLTVELLCLQSVEVLIRSRFPL